MILKRLSLISLMLILSLTLTGLSCKKSTSTPTSSPTTSSSSDLTNVDPTSINESISKYLDLAKTKAREWKNDAALMRITINLPVTLIPGEASESYIFVTSQEKSYWFVISIAESSGKFLRSLISKEDYLGANLQPINENYWKINYLEAFQIAEKSGGKDFRTKNQYSQVSLYLSTEEPKGWLWWVAEYTNQAKEVTKFRINPYDKSVVDENGNIIPSQ